MTANSMVPITGRRDWACRVGLYGQAAWGPARVFLCAVYAVLVFVPAGDRLAPAAPPSPVLPEMVTRDIVKAIDAGLTYLARTQRQDGSWLSTGGQGAYPSVMTSLAGLAFIAGGSTPESGPYARNVTKAMNYILNVAESQGDGLIAGPGSESRSMYGHGFSMLFLAQCYGMESDDRTSERIKKALDKAVAIAAKAQSRKQGPSPGGGWYYTPESNADEGSVTVTQLQALRACRNVGIKVPKSTIDQAVAYLKFCQEPDGGICYSAQSRGGSRPAISAAAIACFYAAGVYDRATGGKGDEAAMVEKLVNYVRGKVSVESGGEYGGYWFYTHLYMAQAMYQRGGDDWKGYYPKIAKRLLATQMADGNWNGDGIGYTYGTAIACIILQLPYEYLPVVQR